MPDTPTMNPDSPPGVDDQKDVVKQLHTEIPVDAVIDEALKTVDIPPLDELLVALGEGTFESEESKPRQPGRQTHISPGTIFQIDATLLGRIT